MLRLLCYEYHKHFAKPSIFIAVLVFSLLSVVKIYGIYNENSLFARGRDAASSSRIKALYWDMYNDFGGEITNAKIEELMKIYRPLEAKTADLTASTANDDPNTYTGNVYNDYHFFKRCFVNPMEYSYMYRSYANKVSSIAKENITFYKSVGNSYEYRKNATIVESFKGREVKNFSYTEMYQYYTHYIFSSILALLICLYGLVGVFVSEKETEMDTLLITTKLGGTKTVTAKLLASILFVFAVCTWFWLLDFSAFASIFGSLKAAFSPLYAISNFSDTALNINLWQYTILSSAVKTAGMLILGMGILVLSSLFKNALYPFIISLAGALGLIYWHTSSMGSGHILRKVLNPFVLMANRELFRKTEFVNIFNFPVPSYLAALIIATLWGVLFAIGIVILVRKNTITHKGG